MKHDQYRRIIVKVGSNLLTNSKGLLGRRMISSDKLKSCIGKKRVSGNLAAIDF